MKRIIKVTDPVGVRHGLALHPEGAFIEVPGDVAANIVKAGKGEITAERPPETVLLDNPLREAVDPLVAAADPLHSARALGLKIDEHPGLVAHAEATGAPKRAGRMAPDAAPVVEPLPDPAKAAKPGK